MKTNIIRTLLIAMLISLLGVFASTSNTFAQQKNPNSVPKITSDNTNRESVRKHKKHKKHNKRKHHKKHKHNGKRNR